MRTRKRVLSFLLAFTLILALLPAGALAAQPDFRDVDTRAYYYDAVVWAVNHEPQITTGTTNATFSPNARCTREQIVTFLWRAAGEPEPKTTACAFTDVKQSSYAYKAILWAVESGVTNGTAKNTFSPNAVVTRGQVVTLLWRYENAPAAGIRNPFTDVKRGDYYYEAVLWAVSTGVTNGMTADAFGPGLPCIRCQVVAFLYRTMAEDAPAPDPAPDPTPDPSPDPDPFPNPNPDAGLPALGDSPTAENALALLDGYDPDGAYLLRASQAGGSDFMFWFDGSSLMDGLGVAVHEECHRYSHQNTHPKLVINQDGSYDHRWSANYYVGRGRHLEVWETEVFPSEKMAAGIPEALRTFRYDTYVGKGATTSSNSDGIYGLMNEFMAYCWGSNSNVSMYDYYLTQPRTAGVWLEYVQNASGDYFAYAEFRYYILSYMLYAREHAPAVYSGILENTGLLEVFQAVDAKYASVIARYFESLEQASALLNEAGIRSYMSGDFFYAGSRGVGTYRSTYEQLMAAMQAPEYVEMYKLMKSA